MVMTTDKRVLVQKAKLSERAGTMATSIALQADMELGHQLSSDERNLLCCLQECGRRLRFFLAVISSTEPETAEREAAAAADEQRVP